MQGAFFGPNDELITVYILCIFYLKHRSRKVNQNHATGNEFFMSSTRHNIKIIINIVLDVKHLCLKT